MHRPRLPFSASGDAFGLCEPEDELGGGSGGLDPERGPLLGQVQNSRLDPEG